MGVNHYCTVRDSLRLRGANKVVKTEVQQTFVNGLLRFLTLGIYTLREARVYCAI
ncbi:hypothetical protein FQ042_22820 [Escherichia coli]|nr:hypothetical protein [Escherichia coli]